MGSVLFFSGPQRPQSPTVAVHKAHLSHYVSQLAAVEQEQRRITVEQKLLSRRQAQLAANRDQLMYLIAEEQDLVLRALQQQQRAEEQHAAAVAAALRAREEQIARRQKLRYAVYQKQQEEQRLRDMQLRQALASGLGSPFYSQASYDNDEKDPIDSGIRPGSVTGFLRGNGLQAQNVTTDSESEAPSRSLPASQFKRGSRRGTYDQLYAPTRPKLSSAESSAKLIPGVDYDSAQDLLNALFGTNGENSIKMPSEPEPEVETSPEASPNENENEYATEYEQKKPESLQSVPVEDQSQPQSLTYSDLAKLLFGGQPLQDMIGQKTAEEQLKSEPPIVDSRPSFQYTLSAPPVPGLTPERSSTPELDTIERRIKDLSDKIAFASSGVGEISASSADETSKRKMLLETQAKLEKYYSDLDDILMASTDGEDEGESLKSRKHELRLQKHEATKMAVDAADAIDKILEPRSEESSEFGDEETEDQEQQNINERSAAAMIAAMTAAEDASTPTLMEVDSELPDSKVTSSEMSGSPQEGSQEGSQDDSYVIVGASKPETPVEINEAFIPEASDKTGHVILEHNAGDEVDEFLDEEEQQEQKSHMDGDTRSRPNSIVDNVKQLDSKRSESPVRHVVLEEVDDAEGNDV
ncbi:hypothetical protein V1511DRAFT_491976 [Dipodascopsis uninucleata]